MKCPHGHDPINDPGPMCQGCEEILRNPDGTPKLGLLNNTMPKFMKRLWELVKPT